MVERKNTISFIEFMRGKYNIDNNDYILKLFDRDEYIRKRKNN